MLSSYFIVWDVWIFSIGCGVMNVCEFGVLVFLAKPFNHSVCHMFLYFAHALQDDVDFLHFYLAGFFLSVFNFINHKCMRFIALSHFNDNCVSLFQSLEESILFKMIVFCIDERIWLCENTSLSFLLIVGMYLLMLMELDSDLFLLIWQAEYFRQLLKPVT